MLSPNEILKRLKEFKKPKSMVEGEIFPAPVNRAAIDLAMPLTHIYNWVSLTHRWPEICYSYPKGNLTAITRRP